MSTLHAFQSCPTLCDPMDCSPPGSCPWDSPGKNTGVGCHALSQGLFPTQGLNPSLILSPALAGRFFIPRATLHWEIKGVLGAPSPRSACFLASASGEEATGPKHGQSPARTVRRGQGAKVRERPGAAPVPAVLPACPVVHLLLLTMPSSALVLHYFLNLDLQLSTQFHDI